MPSSNHQENESPKYEWRKLAREHGIHHDTLRHRVARWGSLDRALTTPTDTRFRSTGRKEMVCEICGRVERRVDGLPCGNSKWHREILSLTAHDVMLIRELLICLPAKKVAEKFGVGIKSMRLRLEHEPVIN